MKRILFTRNLIVLLCLLLAAGCAATKTTTKPAKPSPPPKPAVQAESHPESRPATPPPKALQEILYVTADQVKLRSCPSAQCKTTAMLKSGEELVKLGQKEDWTIVRVKTTRLEGWVASNLVGKTPPKKKPASKSKEAAPPRKTDKQTPSDLQEEFSP